MAQERGAPVIEPCRYRSHAALQGTRGPAPGVVSDSSENRWRLTQLHVRDAGGRAGLGGE